MPKNDGATVPQPSLALPKICAARLRGPRGPLLRLSAVAAHIDAAPVRVSDLDPDGGRSVSLGGLRYRSKAAARPALVPRGHYYSADGGGGEDLQWEDGGAGGGTTALEIWQWLLRKDALQQDCFLIGPPGARRRRLALAWCEALGREVEYLALSRDTTESDLKQRREIRQGSLEWADQPPVRAARHGRVLILDGLEKAERNVLPTLNNLLENREMALQDGTFLTAPERFDALGDTAAAANLVRVHEGFRVIALGLPVPAFPGFPLDPPLRSRFQARYVGPPSLAGHLAGLKSSFPSVNPGDIEALVTFSDAIAQMAEVGSEAPGPRPWPLPEGALASACAALTSFPLEHVGRLLHRAYPHTLLPMDTLRACDDALKALDLQGGLESQSAYSLKATENDRVGWDTTMVFAPAIVGAAAEGENAFVRIPVSTGTSRPSLGVPPPLVETPTLVNLVSEAMQCVALGSNVCFVGANGEGKTVLARQLAVMLGYPAASVHTLHVYKDMTSRDLFQRRSTDGRGDTHWEMSPLLTAIIAGGVCILDGLHRLRPDTIAALQTLCLDSGVELPDGTRFCRHDCFVAACRSAGAISSAVGAVVPDRLELEPGRWLRPVHRNFRLVALATPPGAKPTEQWLSSEILPLFSWVLVPRLGQEERALVLRRRCPSPHLEGLLRLTARLEAAVPKDGGGEASHAGWTLSLRQLLRLGRRAAQHPSTLAADVKRVALEGFMPAAARAAFGKILREEVGGSSDAASEQAGIRAHVAGGVLDIGGSRLPVGVGADPRLIPKTLFYDIPRHLLRLREIMRDLGLGERHLLLIGNQGTGKNKLADHLLHLLQWEREYIQLHRDTTVSALTVQATLVDGKVVWEDSPLVQAVTHGRTLMVDEADKAPLEVVCILKGLVEDGEMTLSDGRRILRETDGAGDGADEKVIPVHPNFKMFLLANRPGFPFQGNDLFRETGDVFAPHIIENPDLDSEVQLLRNYAPDVEAGVLRRLSNAFTELRQQVDEGLLTYPYSTRELVNVSKHLQKYPGQSVGQALRDILDFDQHDAHALGTLREVLLRWGIPLDARGGGGAGAVETAVERRLPEPTLAERWLLRWDSRPTRIVPAEVASRDCTFKFEFVPGVKVDGLQGGRAERFTEELRRWRLPLSTSQYGQESAVGAVVLPGSGTLCVLVEKDDTRSVSVLLHDLSAGLAATNCDRVDASFTLRQASSHRDSRVELLALGPRTFGLASDRFLHVIDLGGGGGPLVAHELTLPPAVAPPEADPRPEGQRPLRWNTDFASQGAAICWAPGSGTAVIIDALSRKGSLLSVPELAIQEIWALSEKEMFIAGDGDDLLRLEVSLGGTFVQSSGVLRAPLDGRGLAGPIRVAGAPAGMLPGTGSPCGVVTTADGHCGTLAREGRTAYARRAELEHYGKDAFATTVWPRSSPVAATLHHAAAAGGMSVTAVRPAGAPEGSWAVEVAELERGALRILDPARLGAPAGEGTPPPPPAPLCALHLYGTHAVLVQSNGWVRVLEASSAALAEQQKQWQSMVGTQAEEPLELRIIDERTGQPMGKL